MEKSCHRHCMQHWQIFSTETTMGSSSWASANHVKSPKWITSHPKIISTNTTSSLHGPLTFNWTPLGPPGTGTRVLVHELPDARGTWAPHAVLGYYTGPASEHYWCYKVWIKETASECIANTLVWWQLRLVVGPSVDEQGLGFPNRQSAKIHQLPRTGTGSSM